MFAQVVVGLPIEGPFDYSVPPEFQSVIQTGMRVSVSFRFKNLVGFVVGLSKTSTIRYVKPIRACLDEVALFDPYFLKLGKELSRYYCCSWGEALETMLPARVRRGARLKNPLMTSGRTSRGSLRTVQGEGERLLLHCPQGTGRWQVYCERILQCLQKKVSTILLLPDIASVKKAKTLIDEKLKCQVALLSRGLPGEMEGWERVASGFTGVVIGTRSAIFSPLKNCGLIIIDEEQDPAYKQEQAPHYHCREIALWRARFEKATLIFCSATPSLECMYLVRKKEMEYLRLEDEKAFPEVKTLEMYSALSFKNRNMYFSRYLLDALSGVLQKRGKALLFLNRTGFATFASCQTCGVQLQCPRCERNLVYHFKEKRLACHNCNFNMEPPQICPKCNAGYIKYAGYGTEKVESELARILPQAKIMRLDHAFEFNLQAADIFIATQSVFKQANVLFDLVGVLSIDQSLHRIDFRATEKTFGMLRHLAGLTKAQMIIQTSLSKHYCFRALEQKDDQLFYDEEFSRRKQLRFPPFSHMGMVKLRAAAQEKVKDAAGRLYETMGRTAPKPIQIISCQAALPAKLRGNYYWQIVLSGASALKLSSFLKECLKTFSHSGIIVTVDIDPL